MAKVELDVAEMVEETFEKHFGVTLDRLRELAEADRDGRCVVLPCKVERIKDAVQKLYESNGCLYSDIGLSHDYGDCSQGCYQCVVDGLRAEAALDAMKGGGE